MTKAEYFYFEWLIIEKQMTSEIYLSLTEREMCALIEEYRVFKSK